MFLRLIFGLRKKMNIDFKRFCSLNTWEEVVKGGFGEHREIDLSGRMLEYNGSFEFFCSP